MHSVAVWIVCNNLFSINFYINALNIFLFWVKQELINDAFTITMLRSLNNNLFCNYFFSSETSNAYDIFIFAL